MFVKGVCIPAKNSGTGGPGGPGDREGPQGLQGPHGLPGLPGLPGPGLAVPAAVSSKLSAPNRQLQIV